MIIWLIANDMNVTRTIVFSLLVIGCTFYKKPIHELRLFRPNYDLNIDDLVKIGFVIEEAEDGFVAVKKVNDSIIVRIQVDKKLGLLLKETWELRFRKMNTEQLTYFLLSNSSIIVSESCDSDDDVLGDEGQDNTVHIVNFNFFVQCRPSGRFFQCNFSNDEYGRSVLEITHDYPFLYKDENNPRFREVYGNWREILEVQGKNEIVPILELEN